MGCLAIIQVGDQKTKVPIQECKSVKGGSTFEVLVPTQLQRLSQDIGVSAVCHTPEGFSDAEVQTSISQLEPYSGDQRIRDEMNIIVSFELKKLQHLH